MNISSANYNLTSDRNTTMSFNLVNDSERTTSNQRQSVFGNSTYKPIEWSQVTPQQMPWAQNPSQYSQVMTFGSPNFFQHTTNTQSHNFQSNANNQQSNGFQVHSLLPQQRNMFETASTSVDRRKPFVESQFSSIHYKRKKEIGNLAPSKQHITEERMAAHMSKLHISSETPLTIEAGSNQEPPAEREKRLVMCEEMRRLQTENIIPSALMKRNRQMPQTVDNRANNNYSRLERPCMAVMLWQPPDKAGLISSPSSSSSYVNSIPSTSSGDNNNTTSSVNLNRKSSTEDTDDDDGSSSLDDMDMEL